MIDRGDVEVLVGGRLDEYHICSVSSRRIDRGVFWNRLCPDTSMGFYESEVKRW